MRQKKHYIGLSDVQVVESRKQHGKNILTPLSKESIWIRFFKKFKDSIIRILLLAFVASIGMAYYQYYIDSNATIFLEPLGILATILLTTCISFAFELHTSKKFEILNQIKEDIPVKTIRNGYIVEIPRKEIVVGDIVFLETGDEVPADGKLHEAISLQINESTLTGEPITKKTTDLNNFNKNTTYPSNKILKGTSVIEGHGIMEVSKVGDITEYGKVYKGVQIENKIVTPLNQQLNHLSKLIICISYIIVGLIIIVRLTIYFTKFEVLDWRIAGNYILNTIMTSVTIIVLAIPEGLPMSITLSLALNMKRMLSNNNLVRRMHACETLGATTVICTDKTGTLTQNQMRVYRTNFLNFNKSDLNITKVGKLIAEGISINSTANLDFSNLEKVKIIGNPTEGALLLWLHDNNINYSILRENVEITEQLTFSSERKYMATVVNSFLLKKKILYVKGAPEIILSHCKSIPSTNNWENLLLTYQNQAMRTISFAYKVLENNDTFFREKKLGILDLTFLGIVAISNPIRTDVPKAVQKCLDAGINIKIVTGDTPNAAKEIGRQIGLWEEKDSEKQHMTSTEFAKMEDDKLLETILDLKILSRARPIDKERLVKLLQQKNQVVTVTGDGTNDASALNTAQVGLSMGDGTSVAKEASDIIILDNSFSSISLAIMWGRSLYQNIQRFILFQMIINVAACLIVLISVLLGTESPLTVTQILWINLIMDTFASLALASLHPNERVMKDKPRKTTDCIITKKMRQHTLYTGLIFVFILFGLLQYFKYTAITSLSFFKLKDFFINYLNFNGVTQKLSDYELSVFFTTFVMLQFWNIFNAKAFNTGKSAFFKWKQNFSGFGLVSLIIIVGQYLIVTFGGKIFNVVPLKICDWGIIIGTTSIVLWVGEILRLKNNFFQIIAD